MANQKNTAEIKSVPETESSFQSDLNSEYSLAICQKLEKIVAKAGLLRDYHPSRYDAGKILDLEVIGVCPAYKARTRLEVARFVGGGFAGQVYQTRLIQLEPVDEPIPGLEVGKTYAVKILIPPSRFSLLFRNLIYWLAYQGPFSAQVNEAAARVGVLWQKLIRRGAQLYFGTERAVVDTYATFYDAGLRSFGEINEWITGRNWKFEIDDQLFRRRKWKLDELVFDTDHVGSPEYLAKRAFMARLVRLLHAMGAPELARQYEWWTAKSQPNVLKRLDATDGPADGLMGIDFRAGLALLPFLPMSPADVKLIVRGLFRGNLVQFDRGDLKQLSEFVEKHKSLFEDLRPALEELYQAEPAYRRSLPDITHHGIRLITDRSLRRSVTHGLIEGWQHRDQVDEDHAQRLKKSSLTFALFYLTGVLPLLGRLIRRIWGNARYARHLKKVFTSWDYFRRALHAKQAEKLIDWYRDGRVNDQRATALVERPVRFWTQRFLLSWLPPKWHRFLTEPSFAWTTIKETVQYPIRFYRNAEFREQWLTEQVMAGYEEGMLTDEEKDRILERVKDPFIQKYLKCVAVHICTLPVTQVVSVILAIYAMLRFGNTWQESMAYAIGVLAFFQATPVSPGSITRGSYVLYLMIKERNWRDYWVAALVSFWHYIGYLGFPIQMVTKFPSLSRLMAGRWATSMVRIIPVFGERGALLEHWIFDLFFNLPLSLRRKLKKE